jgi:nicotinamide-nucleotide amidase
MPTLTNTEQAAPILVARVAHMLLQRQWMLATAESCTGGLIAAACTDVAGSSAWFERGFVSYSNASKTELLGVDPALLERCGAVSQEVVRAMAQGALQHSHAQVAVAVTGVAGPSGGTNAKPVGTVWFGWATPAGVTAEVQHFGGDRAAVRAATVSHALQQLTRLLVSASA